MSAQRAFFSHTFPSLSILSIYQEDVFDILQSLKGAKETDRQKGKEIQTIFVVDFSRLG